LDEEAETTTFLNVDLDILSRSPLEPLVEALGKGVFVHHVGREGKQHGAHVSLSSYDQSADSLMRAMARRVEKLAPVAKKLWNTAVSREFNVGIQAGLSPHCHEVQLTNETVRLVGRLGGHIRITTYAPATPPEVARSVLATKGVPPNIEMRRARPAQAKKPRR
jgi:hypothetical protein